jgi:hypothetical protein
VCMYDMHVQVYVRVFVACIVGIPLLDV